MMLEDYSASTLGAALEPTRLAKGQRKGTPLSARSAGIAIALNSSLLGHGLAKLKLLISHCTRQLHWLRSVCIPSPEISAVRAHAPQDRVEVPSLGAIGDRNHPCPPTTCFISRV